MTLTYSRRYQNLFQKLSISNTGEGTLWELLWHNSEVIEQFLFIFEEV